jgi:hypothetical protein
VRFGSIPEARSISKFSLSLISLACKLYPIVKH